MTTPQTTEEWVRLFNHLLHDLDKKQHDTASTANNETLRLLRCGRIAMLVDLLWMIDEESLRTAAKEQA